jgi:uncharacterized protein (DUF2267 family)
MNTNFDKYAQRGNEFLVRLAKNLGNEKDLDSAFRILRSTLKVLRKHFTVEESMQMMAQLPIAMKGIYVDGWKFHSKQDRIKTVEQFANEMILEEGNAAWRDFANINDCIKAISAVTLTLAAYVSPHELEEAFGTLPKELRNMFRTWIPS